MSVGSCYDGILRRSTSLERRTRLKSVISRTDRHCTPVSQLVKWLSDQWAGWTWSGARQALTGRLMLLDDYRVSDVRPACSVRD